MEIPGGGATFWAFYPLCYTLKIRHGKSELDMRFFIAGKDFYITCSEFLTFGDFGLLKMERFGHDSGV